MRNLCICLLLLFTGATLAEETVADRRSVKAISHSRKLRLNLWADSSQLANPVAITFDEKGRMYVCETFRQSKGVEDNRGHMSWLDDDLAAQSIEDRRAYFKKHLGDDYSSYEAEEDRITVLEDTDGDGRADNDWVFADNFRDAMTGTGAGVLAIRGKVYYTCIPDLWSLHDSDDDGQSDERSSLHYGYGVRVAFRGHDSHGLILGPDGRLYFSIGDRGYNIETEGKVLKDPESGAVFRCELDGSGLEVFATGLRNPQELAFDDHGNLFTGENNSDSGDEARLVHVVEGGETGWRMAFQYLSDRGPWNREKLWHPRHEGQPAYIIPPVTNFADGPSGFAYYPGTGLGDAYRNTFFLCDFRGDATMSGIRTFQMLPSGATFEMSRPEKFLWNVLATDIEFGPDGGAYVSDWIEGWEGVNRGRIIRVTAPQTQNKKMVAHVSQLLKQDFSDAKVGKLLNLLKNRDRRVRMKSQLELAKRGAAGPLGKVASSSNRSGMQRMHAVWALGHIARTTKNSLRKVAVRDALPPLAQDKDDNVRAAVISVMGDVGYPEFRPALVTALTDRNPRVRSLAAIGLGKTGTEEDVQPLLEMIAENNDGDVVLRHSGAMGLAGIASEERLGELASDGHPAVRLAAVLALRKLKSPRLADFLADDDPYIVREAALAIHDVPVPEAMSALAALAEKSPNDEALMRRVLNANFRDGSADAAMAVAQVIGRDVSDVIKLEAIDMLDHWDEPSSRDRVLGMWRPIGARSGEVATVALRKLVGNNGLNNASAEVAVRVAEVGAYLGLQETTESIRELIVSPDVKADQRADLLGALVTLEAPRAIESVTVALGDKSPLVRSKARELMVSLDPARGLRQLQSALRSGETIERQAALAVLSNQEDESSAATIRDYAMELSKGNVPADTQLDLVEAARKRGLESSIETFVTSLADQPYAERSLAISGGDADRGRDLFFNNVTLSCVRCHRVGETGGRVGPNLAGIGKTKTPDYLLESIVDPNKAIAKGFGTLIVVTEDGLQHQGILQKETDDLLHLIDAEGKRFHISKEEIIARQNGKSAMPEDLVKKLNNFELRDLVAYLSSLQTPWVEDDAGHEE